MGGREGAVAGDEAVAVVKRWPSSPRKRALSDDELLAVAADWTGAMPQFGAPPEAFDAWRTGFRAWCREVCTDSVEILRMQVARKIAEVSGDAAAD